MGNQRKTLAETFAEKHEANEFTKMLSSYVDSFGKTVENVNNLPKEPTMSQVKMLLTEMKITHKKGVRLTHVFLDAQKLELDPVRKEYLLQMIGFVNERQNALISFIREFENLLMAVSQARTVDFTASLINFKKDWIKMEKKNKFKT